MRKTTQLRTLFALGLILPAAVLLALFVVRAYAHDPGGADQPEGAAAVASTEEPVEMQPGVPGGEAVTRGEAEGIPLRITHQGVIKVDGRRFNGTGYFRFALVDADTGDNVWTTGEITVPVAEGVYRVALGDPLEGMDPIPTSVFTDHWNLLLRIWFNDGPNGEHQLFPDLKVTSTGYAYQAASVTDGITGSGTPGSLPKFTDGSTLGDSVIQESGGNVGIGTVSPSSKLDIRGEITAGLSGTEFTTAANGAVTVSNAGGPQYNLTDTNAGGHNWSLRATGGANPSFSIEDAGARRFTISENGNVGIKTASPNGTLQVAGGTQPTDWITLDAAYYPVLRTGESMYFRIGDADYTHYFAAADIGGTIGVNYLRPYGAYAMQINNLDGLWVLQAGWTARLVNAYYLNVARDFYVYGSKYFKIDHPLDAANQFLVHSSVESSDRMNVYNGNIILDENGQAWVELPGWFDALNRDFRYQLTCIGGFAPIYVADEIADNRFRIAGGRPGLKVSWQVTGIRNDPYARDHPMSVEKPKSETERGKYLYPQGYGMPQTMEIGYREPSQPVQLPGDGESNPGT